MITISLRDHLKRNGYAWPETLISEPVSFDVPVSARCLALKDESGSSVAFQLTGVQEDNDGLHSAVLHFVSALPSGGEKRYVLTQDADAVPRAEQPLRVSVHAAERRIFVPAGERTAVLTVPMPIVSVKVIAEGDVFSDTEILCIEGQRRYTLSVRRFRVLPFFELRENMCGFEGSETGAAVLQFENTDFRTRYSWMRPVEKIDDYLKGDGTLPVTLMPYENWVPWCQSKYIAFSDGKQCEGLFLRDCLLWKEEGYPIWGSTKSFGIRFSYGKDTLSAFFPMANGERSTAVAFYPGDDVTQIRRMWTWQALLNLDKVRKWTLDWQEAQTQYPRFFPEALRESWCGDSWFCKQGEKLPPEKLDAVIDTLSPSVRKLQGEDEEGMTPVVNREFSEWTVLFDVTASQMNPEQYARAKAFFAFMAYTSRDENYMPTKNMFAGHPNFLADTAAVSGLFSALFPGHPEAATFRDYFNETVRGNLRYHIRPDVADYESVGGRETENPACYSLALLRPYMHVYTLFEKMGYPIALRCKSGARWLDWTIGTLSAPVDGRRIIPQQGAHARISEIPYQVCELAQLLEKEYPASAENAYAALAGSQLIAFEIDPPQADPYRHLFRRKDGGKLHLRSEKYTGYGCVFREAVGTEDEISLHVQQLDRGPNYRWGTFENTGNGGIFYYAAGKRYSYVAREDTGDRNLGAEEGSCGFSALRGHTFHNIGFHDLTEPMFAFPLVKQTKLLADGDISAYYRYRRVSLVGKDYAVLYDALTHMRACGRFHWSVNALEEFPQIYQLLPGCKAVYPPRLEASFVTGNGDANALDESLQSKSVYFEGDGNFLTVVTHRKDVTAHRTEYGAQIALPERTDFVFEDAARIRYEKDGIAFDGYSGIVSLGRDGTLSGAMTEGKRISAGAFSAALDGKAGIYFRSTESGYWEGELYAQEPCMVTICDETVQAEKGRYIWKYGDVLTLARQEDRQYDSSADFVRDTRRHEFGFHGYDFEDTGEILTYPQ